MTKTNGTTEFGRGLIADLQKLRDALASGGMEEVEKQFRVTRVKIPPLVPGDVTRIRKGIGATQAVFASLLGVTPVTVRAWESGKEELSRMAEKFINEMRYNSDYWRQRVKVAMGNAKRSR
jgi:DNA-binding transcriptional regulator YiaG